jgi:hypothetical protein
VPWFPNHELTKLESHFSFGQDWASHAEQIGKRELAAAKEGLRRLLGGVTLAGKRLLDVGYGSGVHSLASGALVNDRLGGTLVSGFALVKALF